mmetsp:Transcript_2365/g.4290  ORF Transcript_2365/g.4290 Transcript_2365/m.4290 type:complete len:105 (+) Transcript_2365:174-488(+)
MHNLVHYKHHRAWSSTSRRHSYQRRIHLCSRKDQRVPTASRNGPKPPTIGTPKSEKGLLLSLSNKPPASPVAMKKLRHGIIAHDVRIQENGSAGDFPFFTVTEI